MFREGRQVQTTSDAEKKYIVFFIECSFIFRGKSMQNREKKRVKRLSAQKSAKKHV